MNAQIGDGQGNGPLSCAEGADPERKIIFTFNASQAPYTVNISRRSGPAVHSTLYCTTSLGGSSCKFNISNDGRSMPILANASGAFTTTGIDSPFWNGLFLNEYYANGPTKGPLALTKPDITAPSTATTLSAGLVGGTSTAAPVIAGVAAMLKQVDPTVTATTLESTFVSLAVDIGALLKDNVWGWGKIQLGSSPPFPWTTPTDTDGDGIPDENDNHCEGFASPTTISGLSPSTRKPGLVVGVEGTGFEASAVGFVGNNQVAANVITSTSATFTAPDVPDGHYAVRIEHPEGCRSLEDPMLTVDSNETSPPCGLLGIEAVLFLGFLLPLRRNRRRN